eukprot:6863279-Alexandrium_andersonii.AAC.1
MLWGQVGVHGGRAHGQSGRGLCVQQLRRVSCGIACVRVAAVHQAPPSVGHNAPGLPPCGP